MSTTKERPVKKARSCKHADVPKVIVGFFRHDQETCPACVADKLGERELAALERADMRKLGRAGAKLLGAAGLFCPRSKNPPGHYSKLGAAVAVIVRQRRLAERSSASREQRLSGAAAG